jgi:UDP-hydrolysing UDP-N-acetyl-D-glucosamine 2-epimerase
MKRINKRMRRICFVINSRANYARIKSVLIEMRNRVDCELQIVVGASGLLFRFGNVVDIIKRDGFKVDREVYSVVEGNEPIVMAKTTGLAILELSQVFSELKPDIVVTVADRHETIATAIAASYMNIMVAHTQGGEITGSIDESVRHACTKLSHLHFPATQGAYKNIIQMGEEKKRVHMTGCPSLDFIDANVSQDMNSILEKYIANPKSIKNKDFLLVLFHADTKHYDEASSSTREILKAVMEINFPTIWLWPNVDAGTDFISKELRKFRDTNPNSKIQFVRNFSPEEYITVLNNTKCIIGNSSSGIRESSRIGTPSITIGSRQCGREMAENVICLDKINAETIEAKILQQINHGKYEPSNLYGDGSAGIKIAEILCTTEISIDKKFVSFN